MMDRDRERRDEELRELFTAMRREEEALAPRFAPVRRANRPVLARGGRGAWRVVAAAAVCVLVAAALLWLQPIRSKDNAARERGLRVPVASITEWRPPTDFLLNTPGREMLRTVPAIATQPYFDPGPARIRKAPDAPRRIAP